MFISFFQSEQKGYYIKNVHLEKKIEFWPAAMWYQRGKIVVASFWMDNIQYNW